MSDELSLPIDFSSIIGGYDLDSHTKTKLDNFIKEILSSTKEVKNTFKSIYKYPEEVNPNMSTHPVLSISPNVYKTVIYPYVSSDNTPLDLNLFINHDPSVPHNTFIVDYFNSGEIFCNLSEINLEHALPNLTKLYSSYLTRSDFSYSNLPVGYTSPLIPYAITCQSPANANSIAWSFPLNKFFTYNHTPKDTPICQYYTHHSSDKSVPVIISPHYKYANTVLDQHACSHPVLSENPFHCSSYNSFSSCAFYSPMKNELLSNTIASSHSSSAIDFVLTYSFTRLGNHNFTITNKTINEDVNVLVYPSSYSYDECLKEATSIYHEYIEPYISTSHIISQNENNNFSDSTKAIEKESYITSLLVG